MGDGKNGCYYRVAECTDKQWHVSAWVDVDSETLYFEHDILTDAGPFDSQAEAEVRGMEAAPQWCIRNDVEPNHDE
jgi:hypothetical protein